MSSDFLMLVLKTNIYKSKIIVIQHCTGLVNECFFTDSDFMDGNHLIKYQLDIFFTQRSQRLLLKSQRVYYLHFVLFA